MSSGTEHEVDECSICMETPELKWTLPCNHSFCYLCLKGAIESANNGCPLCRGPIPNDVYENAKMKDMGSWTLELENVDYRWLYSGRNDGWWAYSDSHNRIIEAAFKSFLQEEMLGDGGDDSVSINIYGKVYTISFTDMTQKSPYNDWRNIKRLAGDEDIENFDGKTLKGIAGIQVEH